MSGGASRVGSWWRRRVGTASLRSRLAWGATLVVAAWALLLAVGAYLLLGEALEEEAEGVLRARAQAVAATVAVDAGGAVELREGGDDSALDVGTWVYDPDGAVVERPPGASERIDEIAGRLARRAADEGAEVVVDAGLVTPTRLLALPVGTSAGGAPAVVVTSASFAPYEGLRELAAAGSAVAGLALVVVVHLVLRATVARALQPVQDMTAQAARWSADDVDRRFGAAPRPAELAALAAVLDGVLDRVGAALRHERTFTAEVSHELRTPLARVRAEVDWLRRSGGGGEDVERGLATLDEAAATLEGVVVTLLDTARASSSRAPGRAAARPVLEGLAGAARERRPEVDVEVAGDVADDAAGEVTGDVAGDVVVGVDAAVLERLLQPVVDNAVRHARSRVRLSAASAPDDGVVVAVDDDGPGIPSHLLEEVFVPGVRGDPGDGHDGAGLGLALVRRLARAAGGDAHAEGRPGGRVVVRLPRG
ncbi:HAMP domain-containing sensor histidine kinase [uncultured Pseudokineococcus sp.]|uniref:sensor histidine kinase n=1 Tax=uncultured Pseudokineococcus sp. TaxID=1642928 RepID=UPI00260FDE76|nr:HAMP domain-containing sensor histidine kinase [uncultured Pseudokineococcus sp.]